jgi:hypothetical protein
VKLIVSEFEFSFVLAPGVDSDEAGNLAKADFGVKSYISDKKYVYVEGEKIRENGDCRF